MVSRALSTAPHSAVTAAIINPVVRTIKAVDMEITAAASLEEAITEAAAAADGVGTMAISRESRTQCCVQICVRHVDRCLNYFPSFLFLKTRLQLDDDFNAQIASSLRTPGSLRLVLFIVSLLAVASRYTAERAWHPVCL